ncbi:MAG: methyltransferase domain-containing protein [Myxococcota bacterium]
MGDGRGDLQAVWHVFAGEFFDGKTILDVGAAIGRSRERLSRGGQNRVTLQDIDRSLMPYVDIVQDVRDIEGKWDVVTTFDVIEHAADPDEFLNQCARLARESVMFTTPSYHLYTQPWHFKPAEIIVLARRNFPGWERLFFARYKEGDRDEVLPVSAETFAEDLTIYAHGMCVQR